MRMRFEAVLLLCLCGLARGSSSVFDGVLGNSQSCARSCAMTYSLHTYPSEDELYACQRGCRLFSICQFVSDSENLNQTRVVCESACDEAYTGDVEKYACSLGCQNQLPFAQERQEQLLEMVPRIHLLYPLSMVRGMWDDMMSQAQQLFTSSWTVYVQNEDGEIMMYQSEPQIEIISQNEDVKEKPYEVIKQPLYKKFSSGYMHKRIGLVSRDQSDFQGDSNFFNCLSRNSWLPAWILTSTLILSVMVLIWICCATVATAAQQYLPVQKLSLNGDLEYLMEHKLVPYPESSLLIVTSSEKEDEAGPLPAKIKLDLSEI